MATGTIKDALKRTLLWTNSAPTTAFGQQTIQLALANYDEVEVVYTTYSNQRYICPPVRVKIGENGILFAISGDNGFFAGKPSFIARGFAVNANGVVFQDGVLASTASSTYQGQSMACIPQRIYGIKY